MSRALRTLCALAGALAFVACRALPPPAPVWTPLAEDDARAVERLAWLRGGNRRGVW